MAEIRNLSVRYRGRKLPRRWTETEVAEARRLQDERLSLEEIDRRLGRIPGATRQKFKQLEMAKAIAGLKQAGVLTHGNERPVVSPAAVAERDARIEARNRQHLSNITAALFGDPPAGFSALDRVAGNRRIADG